MAKNTNDLIYLSQDTLDRYKEEYNNLINVERPAVQAALKEARAQGDLSENAEYDAARERQSIVEGRIHELESILERAHLIESDNKRTISNKAGIGSLVRYLNLKTNEEREVRIMGMHDSNPLENKISNESPVAQAIMEAEIGEEVEVEVPNKYSIKIISIEN
ncbi:transcription elongation factor GreA [Mycoplasmopsis maculosa]|uniref:Transcription elongation factor GreA n=1 Tax=Mycoplasmopsis maculosa TaxID=114885 RepID=A0A449B456_9BACT|nr:transcription elongation factor GreA [Mycoplasmopsis maculosa]VEU75370.1 transcription elongation factor GreA [Mycoplasmopsis maculosa]